jgi:hypothetical protein
MMPVKTKQRSHFIYRHIKINLSFPLMKKNEENPSKLLKLESLETENQVQLQGKFGRNE